AFAKVQAAQKAAAEKDAALTKAQADFETAEKTAAEAEKASKAADKAAAEAGDADALGNKVGLAEKALAEAEKAVEKAKAGSAEAALKLDAARHAADDAGRELADLDKAVGAA
ncbi:hypothetical protein, partial [Trueperella pyogenes]